MTQRSLREIRIAKRITLAEFASLVGVSLSTCSFWERGLRRVPAQHLPAIAEALGIEVEVVVRALRLPVPVGLKGLPRGRRKTVNAARDAAIWHEFQRDSSRGRKNQLAREHGVTRQRVGQILAEARQ